MKPILALGMGLVALAGFEASQGTLRPGSGSYRTTPPPTFSSTMRGYGQPPPSNYGMPAPNNSGVIGESRFRPYEGQSVYSNRGGLNANPPAPRPRGSLSPYGVGGTGTYVDPYSVSPYGR